jgi:perosamine synthetase
MDVNQIEERISCRTRAIMAVHIYGLPVDMDPVLSLAKRYGLMVIEDAAEAQGLIYKDRVCGSLGDISTFSFYPNKLITTGEGGMAVTDNDTIAEKCRSLRNLCFQKNKRFIHEELGWNFRMTNIQAALGLAQIERLDEFIKKKRSIGQKYTALLKDLINIQLPLKETNYAENIYWIYGLILDENLSDNAENLMEKLKKYGIGTRPFFWPIHQQPVIKKLGLLKNESFPVAERIAQKGFYIPSGLALTTSEINRVSKKLWSILN